MCWLILTTRTDTLIDDSFPVLSGLVHPQTNMSSLEWWETGAPGALFDCDKEDRFV